MKIWITGASGSLGQELNLLIRSIFPEAIVLSPSRQELALDDISKVKEFVSSHKPTHVFHLAAKVFGIAGHKEEPASSLLENTLIDYSVFSALVHFPPEWIFYSSTVASYGFPYKSLPLNEKDWLNGNPHESEMGYAFSKRNGLSYLEVLQTIHKTKFVYGLSTNLFGGGDRYLEGRGHVVISLLEKATKVHGTDYPLEVWGHESSSRDFLSTRSASRIISELINKHAGVVNIASGQEIPIKEIAEEIADVFELSGGIKFVGINSGISRRVCSIEKIKQYSAFVHHVDSRKELSREIRRYKAAKEVK